MAIVEEVAALREQTLAAVAQAADTAALDQVRVAVLGKSGTLTTATCAAWGRCRKKSAPRWARP